MSATECADLQDRAIGNVATQSHRPSGRRVFPPFSGKLIVDEKLELSNNNFKETIYYFFRDKKITPLSQLTATSAFPTPHLLAQFASKAYEDYKTGDTDEQYETRLDLPDGWKLLTTTFNSRWINGYFGAAYWHPEHQQVVIAHRGTKPKNLKALWTDLSGVWCNCYVAQMNSASTFANKVVEVLREVNRMKGFGFQLFFTGHSLGGWLAQITTFTTKYLKEKENIFLKCDNESQNFHPHTVVFDSPGCKDMLSQITDKLEVRLHGRSVDLEHLDITSYLSAPNRINTCHKHVGTVYRIFPDLSEMVWWKKYSPFYNLEAHIMHKIVQVFDPETGQVRKDEDGKLKVQVAVDWPVSVSLRNDEEYTNFFVWAGDYNDYNPGITDDIIHLEGYLTIRYQTKAYDERVSKINVFCQQERLFLERYRWLRQLPESFKSKELLSPIKDNPAQEEAEKMLQNFEIENDEIYCTDVSALQSLIPYVKRLLHLFPWIKQNTERAFLFVDRRNEVYQIETRRYIERINQSPLEFNSDASSLRNFEISMQQQVLHLQIIDGDEWTGLIKAYQLLQKKGCLSEGQYTILTLKRFVTVNQFMDLSKLMQSTVTTHLLLMACEENQLLNETNDVIRTLLDTIKQKPNIKVIFTTRSEGSTAAFLHHMGRRIFGNGFVSRVERLTWSDLTTSSQSKLLEKSVKFQGAKISLNELMSAESPAAKFLPLGALLEGKELKIADPVPLPNAYNKSYYIGRNLCHQKAIKQEIYSDKDVKENNVFLVSTEQKFHQLCQMNPNSIVHWVQRDSSGSLLWKQSQGHLVTVRRYIDTESSLTYAADDLVKLVEQAQHQRVMLISDTAGMGKSTVLTHLSKQIKEKFPAKWVVRTDLNDHTDVLKVLKDERIEQIDKKKAVEFISERMLKLKPGLEIQLFKECCDQKQKVGIVIMVDGFDEISPFYKDTVISLLQALRQTALEQLWITTRPHLRKELEDKLQQLSYTLEPFSEEDQVKFLTKFWSLRDWFTEPKDKDEKIEEKLETYAEHLIKKMATSIGDKDRKLTGIPLQTLMLAEAFDEEVKTFYQSAEPIPELQSKRELFKLYGRFIERKYDIYQEEKLQARVNNVSAIEQRKRDLQIMGENHQLLALKVLFTEEQVTLFQNNREGLFSVEELTRMGIAQKTFDPKPHFIHHTFADYYVADYVVNSLTDWNKTSEQVQAFLLKYILRREDCRVIRIFIEGLLPKCEPSNEMLKQYGNRIRDIEKDGVHILHQVAREGNANIVGFLLDCVQAGGHAETVSRLLLGRDIYRRTAWHVAAKVGNLQVLEKLWECAVQNLTKEERKNKLLLATDNKGKTVYHMAAMMGKVDLLERLWEWAEENLTKEERRNKLLLATDNEGMTAWHIAAKWGNLQVLQKIWEWAEKILTTEVINKLLLATDNKGKTAWNVAAKDGELKVLQKICEWAKKKPAEEENKNKLLVGDMEGRTTWLSEEDMGDLELLEETRKWAEKYLTREELSNKLSIATDNKGKTTWHDPAHKVYLDALQTLWEGDKEKLTRGEIINKYFSATDCRIMTVWLKAAELGNLELLQNVWEWTKEDLKREDLNNKLLLATDNMGRTVCHMAAREGTLELWLKIWEWANQKLETEEIKNNLLLATDNMGRTVCHMAAREGTLELWLKIWEWANGKLKTEEIKSKLLLATDSKGSTAWHLAAQGGKLEVLQEIWEWAKKNLKTDEINNKLILATDNRGRTVCHLAARWSNLNLLQELWEWATEKINPEDVNNKLLLTKDCYGLTALHLAAKCSKLDLLQKIWEWAEGKTKTENMRKKLLLATDGMGMTAWHVAAEECELEILQKLWEWAKDILEPQEVYNKLLLATDNRGRTVFHLAARWNNLELLQKLWKWAEEKLTEKDICNKLLLATDSRGMSAWHVAAVFGNQKLLEKLWELAKKRSKTEEVNYNLLTATDVLGWTVTDIAAKHFNPNILQQLWEWAKENLTTERINNTLLLATDNIEQSVSHIEAKGDKM